MHITQLKLFPEELFPVAEYLAAYVVNPILHDYIFSITVVTAFLYSGFIILYIYMFSELLDYGILVFIQRKISKKDNSG